MHVLTGEESKKGRYVGTVAAYDPRRARELTVVQFSKALHKGWKIYGFLGGREVIDGTMPWRVVVGAVKVDILTGSPSVVRALVIPPTTPHDRKHFSGFRRHESRIKDRVPRPRSERPYRSRVYGYGLDTEGTVESYTGEVLADGMFFWRESSVGRVAVVRRYTLCKTGYHRRYDTSKGGFKNTNYLAPKMRNAAAKGRMRYYIEKPGPNSDVLLDFKCKDGFTWNGWAWEREVLIERQLRHYNQ